MTATERLTQAKAEYSKAIHKWAHAYNGSIDPAHEAAVAAAERKLKAAYAEAR